jgi:hypothetical protein
MPVHEMLLESADKNVRIAAGENIGLMFETANIFLASDVSLYFVNTRITHSMYSLMKKVMIILQNLNMIIWTV